MSLPKAQTKPNVKANAKTIKKPKTNKQTKKAPNKKYVRIVVRHVKKPKPLTPDAVSYANFLKMARRFTEQRTGKKLKPKRRIIFRRRIIKKSTSKKIAKNTSFSSKKITLKYGPKIDAARTVAGSELLKAQMAMTDPNRLDPAARILAGAVASRPKQTAESKKAPAKKKVIKNKKKATKTTTKSSKKL